ncbi:unnamed protein product [Parascedosporium putredinis]|uniref:Peroxisomal membrane protein PEX14 n=1 Tax=Parascedosporium putredinis TaxID=1442378 RepID=A0A9P1HB85_9PEZI|nr:unnamed protein product [Parascedosporium putredinis]CAI8003701.1 unnamed protein product [Parascedosporium putredinis]
MAIREDIVASAAQFLQDPSVASSPVENRVSFLRNKNLTQEEIDAALGRASGRVTDSHEPRAAAPVQAPPHQYYNQYVQPNPWQQPPQPQSPRRDWRDWFIMATVMGGFGYGLYSRYVYPMIAPPTPERLDQDKKDISDKFDKTFALVEQLARDTEALKAAEKDRTERLDTALAELESVINELKSTNRRREDDAQRARDEIQALKESIPAALDAQKSLADSRLKEVNSELISLKTLISRMNAPSIPAPQSRQVAGNSNNNDNEQQKEAPSQENTELSETVSTTKGNGHASPLSGGTTTGKVSIPAWQLAMANKGSADPGAAS